MKDERTYEISLKKFFSSNSNLRNVSSNMFFDSIKKPEKYCDYFKFTSKYFVKITYTSKQIYMSFDTKEKVDSVVYAKRDGKTEYDLLDKTLNQLIEKNKEKRSDVILRRINNIKNIIKTLPEYNKNTGTIKACFEDFLVDTKQRFDTSKYKKKIIVFDTETNGTRSAKDDLLSLSIFDPSSGMCYNRFLPLDLQPIILTSYVNGLSEEDLNTEHLNQEEVNKINSYFDLKNAFVLSFSGGQGKFDSSFILNYCKRHKLHGFEGLDFRNIKSCIPRAPFGCEGQLTKDNLCRIFKIKGITDYHSSMNDCILEYQLFSNLLNRNVFFIGNNLYSYHPDYLIPVSYLNKYKDLARYAKIEIKPIVGKLEKIYEYVFTKDAINQIKKFPTNITGITVEHSFNTLLAAKKQNNFDFLAKNKSKLEYIGSLDSRIKEIPIIENEDGLITSLDKQYNDFIDDVNKVTKVIANQLVDVVKFVKNKIFRNEQILSQELVISEDNKVLALCDLSDKNSVLEVKTYRVVDENGNLLSDITRQLYYQKRGRNAFVMSFFIDCADRENNFDNKKATITIYQVKFEAIKEKPKKLIQKFYPNDVKALKFLKERPNLSIHDLAFLMRISDSYARSIVNKLIQAEVLERVRIKTKNNYIAKKEIKNGETFETEIQE